VAAGDVGDGSLTMDDMELALLPEVSDCVGEEETDGLV
jgi:hypothetical protein